MPTEGAPSVLAGPLLKTCLLIAAGARTQLGKDKTQLRDRGVGGHAPVQPSQRSDSTPTPRPSQDLPPPPARPRPPSRAPPPSPQLSGAPGPPRGRGGCREPSRPLIQGWGAPGPRVAGCASSARSTPTPAWGGGREGDPQRAPLSFVALGHHPLEGRFHSAPLPRMGS